MKSSSFLSKYAVRNCNRIENYPGSGLSQYNQHSECKPIYIVKRSPDRRTILQWYSAEPASTNDNVCAINRTAFNALRGHLKFLEEYSAELEPMDPEVAADKFRKYYSADRQDFFQHLPQKLNVTRLDPADAGVFSTEGEETATLLDDIAYYLDDPQFKTNARGKLSSVTASLRLMISQAQDLLRRCKE